MQSFLQFLVDYYIIFLLITIFLILALIGYYVDLNRKKKNPFLHQKTEISLDNLSNNNEQEEVVMLQAAQDMLNTPVMGGSSTVEALFEGQDGK